MTILCRILAFPFLMIGEMCFWIAYQMVGNDPFFGERYDEP